MIVPIYGSPPHSLAQGSVCDGYNFANVMLYTS